MFRLRLLGTPSIAREDGSLLAGPATHRHRLALLSLLALDRGGGLGREKLMAYLWPERDSEHARHLLNQAVYHLRKTLGEGAILSVGEELRLDPNLIGVDVADFERALDEGRVEAAAGLYTGPLLDGFWLDEAVEFEQWVDRARERLAARYAGALEELARQSEAEGDFDRAVEWWRERGALDPFDSGVVVSLMRALEAGGNPGGALQQASSHEQLLREELGMQLPEELRMMAERLRKAPAPVIVETPALRTATRHQPSMRVDPGGTPTRSNGRRTRGRRVIAALAYGAAGVLIVVTALAVTRWTGAGGPGDERGAGDDGPAPWMDRTSVAVLPLSNLGTDPADAVLADRMTEQLIGILAHSPELRVISSTSSFAFRNSRIDVRRIADSLGVGGIVEGGVQRSGGRLKVRVRLVDASDGTSRWTRTFDRRMDDLFAVQDEVAEAIAGELGVRLSTDRGGDLRRAPTHSIAAYELYLRGSDPALLRSDSGAWEGLEYFRQAILLDSTYAGAYAGMARMYYRVAATAPAIERDRYNALAEEHARKAVALDDRLAEARATLGAIQMAMFDFGSAERHLLQATAMDPAGARTHEWLVTLYLWLGRPDEALAHAEMALARDPLAPSAHAEVARALLFDERCDEALAHLGHLAGVDPPLLRAAPLAAQCHAMDGKWAEAAAILRPQAERGDESALGQLGFVYARSGHRTEALAIRSRLLEQGRDGGGFALGVALVDVGLGELDEALLWLERALHDRSLAGAPGDPAQLMIMSPLMEDLRRHPRFEALRERLGIPGQHGSRAPRTIQKATLSTRDDGR